MKNLNIYLLLILSIVIFSVNGLSQSLTLSWEGETIGDSLLVEGLATDYELVAHAIVTNNTANSMDIKLRRDQLQMVEGTMNYFCWGANCYPPNVDESPIPFTLAAGQSTEEGDFSGHYEPNNNFGDSFIEYEFFNVDNEDENVKVVVQFAATVVGVNEHDLSANVYPNPASDHVTISLLHTMNTIIIYDFTGSKVMEEHVNSSSHKLNTSQLSPGVYFFRITTDFGVTVKQVIVN